MVDTAVDEAAKVQCFGFAVICGSPALDNLQQVTLLGVVLGEGSRGKISRNSGVQEKGGCR